MKFCGHCGKEIADHNLFCPYCGHPTGNRPAPETTGSSGTSTTTTTTKRSSILDHINEYVGGDSDAQLNWRMLFSDVFKRHTRVEAEDIFISGTPKTTPQLSAISTDWPKPWLYSRVFAVAAITYLLLWACVGLFSNPNALPGLMVVGAFAIPFTTMVLFMEVNVYRNISFLEVLVTFFVGGCASLVATLILFSVMHVGTLNYFGAMMVGIIEEVGKAVIVFIFIRRMQTDYILNGMLIGACVGAGFAAFESAGYALQPLFLIGQYIPGYGVVDFGAAFELVKQSIFLRGILAPGGHVAWAAITGAAMIIATRPNKLTEVGQLMNAKFLKLFAIPVVLHFLWDCPLSGLLDFGIHFFLLMLVALVWIVVLFLINIGLKQVSHVTAAA